MPLPEQISTSYVERSHLTLRQSCKRFVRLGAGFSKKLENHGSAVSLYMSPTTISAGCMKAAADACPLSRSDQAGLLAWRGLSGRHHHVPAETELSAAVSPA